ncbi:MAG: phosphatase PAP2 family protein [Novosphingobium sp.]
MDAQAPAAWIARLRDPAGQQPTWLDPESRGVYALLAVTMLVEASVIGLTDFELGHSNIVRNILKLFPLLALALGLRRGRFSRVAVLLESVSILTIAGALAVTGTVLLASISGPFVDSWLDAADRALGFGFIALLHLYRDHPALAVASRWIYAAFALQALLVPVGVALFAPGRFWTLARAWIYCLLVAVLLFPLLPAAGPFVLHGVQYDVFPNLLRLYPWETGPAIDALRSGAMRDVGLAARGFISIPSFHAVGGVLFAWAAWPSRWLRWPMLVLNCAVIASAIITGSHYLVDLLAGMALAAGMLIMLTRRPNRQQVPRPDPITPIPER